MRGRGKEGSRYLNLLVLWWAETKAGSHVLQPLPPDCGSAPSLPALSGCSQLVVYLS